MIWIPANQSTFSRSLRCVLVKIFRIRLSSRSCGFDKDCPQEPLARLAEDPPWTRIKLDVLLQASCDGAEIIVVP